MLQLNLFDWFLSEVLLSANKYHQTRRKLMKNTPISQCILLSCFLMLALTQQNCCNQNRLRVNGNGEVKITPNVAMIYTSLQFESDSASSALSKLNDALNKIYQALFVNGVNKNDVSSSYVSIYPKYDYSSGVGLIVGQYVYVSLTITIKDINMDGQKVAKVIDALSSTGVNSISGITYDTIDSNAGKAGARKNAWNDALTRAKEYAQLSGRKLGKVLVIDQTNQSYYPYSYNANAVENSGLGASDATLATGEKLPELPVGQILVTVTVVVTWQLI